MKCKECGSPCIRGDKFCPACGAPVSRAKGCVLVLLFLVLVIAGLACSSYLGLLGDADIIPLLCPPSTKTETSPTDASEPAVSGADETLSSSTSATETTTTTTTTTENLKAKQAEEIRRMLLTRPWRVSAAGYDLKVNFSSDGTAKAEAKVLFVTKSFDVRYSVSDECRAKIIFSFAGKKYVVEGDVVKVSDELITLTSSDGTVYRLQAA